MLVTISIPDNTAGVFYSTQEQNENYIMESDPKKITFDMIVKVEKEALPEGQSLSQRD